jgi:hypothetical protein
VQTINTVRRLIEGFNKKELPFIADALFPFLFIIVLDYVMKKLLKEYGVLTHKNPALPFGRARKRGKKFALFILYIFLIKASLLAALSAPFGPGH